ncbi:hypothetical protein TYRP_009856, partial [Tyrophagus putrescentiae]
LMDSADDAFAAFFLAAKRVSTQKKSEDANATSTLVTSKLQTLKLICNPAFNAKNSLHANENILQFNPPLPPQLVSE